jgi:hypothetical protein
VYFHDAPAHHLFDAEGVAVPTDLVAFLQQLPGLTEQEARLSDVLTRFRDLQ